MGKGNLGQPGSFGAGGGGEWERAALASLAHLVQVVEGGWERATWPAWLIGSVEVVAVWVLVTLASLAHLVQVAVAAWVRVTWPAWLIWCRQWKGLGKGGSMQGGSSNGLNQNESNRAAGSGHSRKASTGTGGMLSLKADPKRRGHVVAYPKNSGKCGAKFAAMSCSKQ